MRIVHLTEYAAPYRGSFVPLLAATVRAAGQRGWRSELLLSDAARDRPWLSEFDLPFLAIRFTGRTSKRRLVRPVAAVLNESSEPTIVHSHFSAFSIPAVVAATGRRRVAVVWHEHSAAMTGVPVVVRNAIKFGLFGRRVAAILCVSPDVAVAVRRRLGPRHRVKVFPNAIDTARFGPASGEQRAAARRELGVPEDAVMLLHLGREWSLKGGDLYLLAVQRLVATIARPVVAVTVGGGRRAQAAADRLGLGAHLRVLEPTDGIAALYAAADVFVSPSRAEGMPFSVFEALAAGTPVVASDIPGHAPVGRHVAACRLVALDPDALAGAISLTLGVDAEAAGEQRRAAQAWVAANMDAGVWAERLMQLYAEVVETW